jgi:hypothetical protein
MSLSALDRVFGVQLSKDLEKALDTTVETFNNMPADELFTLAAKHADGDIASLFKQNEKAP